jgi:hypothetical protein
MSKGFRIFIFILIALIIFVGMGFWYFLSIGSGYEAYVNENIKPLTLNAVVINKYEEKTGCFGAIIIKQDNHIDTLQNIFYCGPEQEKIWDYVVPSDSIYKEKDSLTVQIVRNGKAIAFIFPTKD